MRAIINKKIEFDSEEYTFSLIDSPDNNIKLQPIACLVLSELLTRNGSVISREELLESVWIGRGYAPSNASLNNTIASIRKNYKLLTGDELGLETVPKQGYEFNCDLEFPTYPSKKEEDTKLNIISNVGYYRYLSNSLQLITVIASIILFIIAIIFQSQTQPVEFKEKKYKQIESINGCDIYSYNSPGNIKMFEEKFFDVLVNSNCNTGNKDEKYDVFLDLNTQGERYIFYTACLKNAEDTYSKCINHKTSNISI
ncbi:winged helix-turn-helix domain-containing protein [Enterobacter kobei]|uniref:winged helix-turn-helix domain-containing protein n=1 Tax=Enterobacter kobei TaxID=208224 RepID=UPI002A8262EB|nr:winged helix-turn-helix domain-containing protein [Enterobacter kobei]